MLHRNVLQGLLLIMIIALAGCDDGDRKTPHEMDPNWYKEFSFGAVTYFHDVARDLWPDRICYAGYRDSLGNGDTEGLLMLGHAPGGIRAVLFLREEGVSALNAVAYDERSGTFAATGTGPTTANTFFRIGENDTVASSYHIAFEGEEVHPTRMLSTETGDMVITGWVKDGTNAKAFVVSVDSIGNIQWAQYIAEPGMHVYGMDIEKRSGGYTVACAYEPVTPGSSSPYSKLFQLNDAGQIEKMVNIKVEDFLLVSFVHEADSGFAVIGTIMNDAQSDTSYIGIIALNGDEKWDADLPKDTVFTPTILIDDYYSFSIYGNMGNTRAVFWIDRFRPGYKFKGGLISTGVNQQYCAVLGFLVIGIKDIEYDLSGSITKAVTFVSGY